MSNETIAALVGERRPKRADAARNYDALVEAARGAFTEQGLAASLEEIARRAGVGIGTLYRNFPTRDALVEAVYVGEVAGVADYADTLSGRDPFEALAAWLHRYADYIATKHVLLDGLNRQSPVLQSCRGLLNGSGAPLLKQAQAEGAVRDDVGIDEVVRLVSGVAGVAFPDAAQRRKVIDVAIDGLRVR